VSRYLKVALLSLLAVPAFAQTRPLRTEEATTAPAGRILLEVGAEYQSDQQNFLTLRGRDVWQAPTLNLVWSPADNVEIDLGWVGRVIAQSDIVFGNVSDFGDVTLRSKMRFFDERGSRPAVGARFTVALPETKRTAGLGPNVLRMSAEALLTKSLGPVKIHANAGLALHDKGTGAAQNDLFSYGFAVAIGTSPSVVAEIAGRAGHGEPVIDRTHVARVGARFGSGRVRWDAAVLHGLTDADGGFGGTLGLTWIAKAGRAP
jgi:hypothetical protein